MAGGRASLIFRQFFSLISGDANARTPKMLACGRTALCRAVASKSVHGHLNVNFQRSLHTSVKFPQRCQEYSTVTATQSATESVSKHSTDLIEQINNAMHSPDVGRLFAVIHLRGNQRKVTTEDIIIVNGDFPPTVGERIRLEKVLMVGGKNFSLIGRPLLSRSVVKVEATVIEKTLSNFRVALNYISGRNYRYFKAKRNPQTMLVINSIELQNIQSERSDTKEHYC